MLRCIDKSNIFLNDSDYEKFIEYIKKASEKAKFTVYAYFDNNNTLINSTFALGYFKDAKDFMEYILEKTDDKCLEHNPQKRYTDEELEQVISLLEDISILHTLEIQARDNMLKNIKETTEASNRQLLRILKIGRGILDNIRSC